jgi:hypothetical protein
VLIQENARQGRSATRRTVLRAVLLGPVGAILNTVAPARAQQKMSKQAAEYQDTPKGILMCATCSLFQPPQSCKVVEGDVRPEGWCKAFDLVD